MKSQKKNIDVKQESSGYAQRLLPGNVKFYHHRGDMLLESGEMLRNPVIAYNTYGKINTDASNVVWVCHALTADSDVAGWWPHTVEKDRFLDPERWFVVCANILGSHYGSTGPLSDNPATGKPYYSSFPTLSIRDMVKAHILLAAHLGIDRIHALIGSSVGGFQAVEWAVEEPRRFSKLILIATSAKASPWTIAIDETQRMAIMTDPSFGQPSPLAGMAGMAAARAIGLLTYRGAEGYNLTQQDIPAENPFPENRRACSYQRYQGEKLCKRYNAYSYVAILDSFDSHDVGRGRDGVDEALKRIQAKTKVVGISSDIIFPPGEMQKLASAIQGAEYAEIDSAFGHDGFLVEHERLDAILSPFMNL